MSNWTEEAIIKEGQDMALMMSFEPGEDWTSEDIARAYSDGLRRGMRIGIERRDEVLKDG